VYSPENSPFARFARFARDLWPATVVPPKYLKVIPWFDRDCQVTSFQQGIFPPHVSNEDGAAWRKGGVGLLWGGVVRVSCRQKWPPPFLDRSHNLLGHGDTLPPFFVFFLPLYD